MSTIIWLRSLFHIGALFSCKPLCILISFQCQIGFSTLPYGYYGLVCIWTSYQSIIPIWIQLNLAHKHVICFIPINFHSILMKTISHSNNPKSRKVPVLQTLFLKKSYPITLYIFSSIKSFILGE